MARKTNRDRVREALTVDAEDAVAQKKADRELEDLLEEIIVAAHRSGLDFDTRLKSARRYAEARIEREYQAREEAAAAPAATAAPSVSDALPPMAG